VLLVPAANGKRKAGLNGSKHSGRGAAESTADADHDAMQVDGSTSDVEVVSDVDEETGSVLGQVGADDDDDEELVVESEDDDGDGDDDDESGDDDADDGAGADAGARAAKRAQAADAASPASNSSRKRARSSVPPTANGGAVQPDQPPSKRSHVVPAAGAPTSTGGPHADSDSKAEADLDREDAMSVAQSEASFATMTSTGSKIPFAARRVSRVACSLKHPVCLLFGILTGIRLLDSGCQGL